MESWRQNIRLWQVSAPCSDTINSDTSIHFSWTFSVQSTLKVASILVTNSTTKYKFLCSFASYYSISFLVVFKLAAHRKCVMLYITTASVHTSLQEFSSNNTGSESDIGMHALSASFFSHKRENEIRIRTRRLHRFFSRYLNGQERLEIWREKNVCSKVEKWIFMGDLL